MPRSETRSRVAARLLLALLSGATAVGQSSAAVIQWHDGQSVSPPGFRTNHAAAWDAGRHRLVVFGGRHGNQILGDTWEWDPKLGWGQVAGLQSNNANVPVPRENAAMAYDSVRQRTVLFGGRDGKANVLPGDTFEWDGTKWTRAATATQVAGRVDHALADGKNRVVLFGGLDQSNKAATPVASEWNGTTWQTISAASNPASRAGHSLTFDSLHDKYVLFGGSESFLTVEDNTWELTGATSAWTWTAKCGPAPLAVCDPGGTLARWFHGATFDPDQGTQGNKGRVVVFGGLKTGKLFDTWAWDGSTWTSFATAGSAVAAAAQLARPVPALAYDDVDRELVIYGGGFPSTPLNDTRRGRFRGQPCDPTTADACAAGLSCSRDHVCCNAPCDKTCQTCLPTKPGPPSVTDGLCRIAVGENPAKSCNGDPGCVGYCDGSGKCFYGKAGPCGSGGEDDGCAPACSDTGKCVYPKDTTCGNTGSFFCGGRCSGKGKCVYPGSTTVCEKICAACDGKGNCNQPLPSLLDSRCASDPNGNSRCPAADHGGHQYNAAFPKGNCVAAPFFQCGWLWRDCF